MTSLRSIGVIGAGKIGSHVAQSAALEGLKVVLVDIKPTHLEKALEKIQARLIEDGVNDVKEVLSRIRFTTNPQDLKGVFAVLEAIDENRESKFAAFKHVDQICDKSTLFATSVLTERVDSLAKAVSNPERMLGMHFYCHRGKSNLAEIVYSPKASPEAVEKARAVARALGHIAIVCKEDVPGFIVNRLFVAIMVEAIRNLIEGTASIKTVDAAGKEALGFEPFATLESKGVDYLTAIANDQEQLGELFKIPDRLKDQTAGEKWTFEGDVDEDAKLVVQERLQGVAYLVGLDLVQNKIARPEDVDFAATLGLGWNGGPFESMNTVGIKKSLRLVKATAKHHEIAIPSALKEQAANDICWSLRRVDIEKRDGVATVTINNPSSKNAFNENVIKQMNAVLDDLEEDDTTKVVVFAGAGKVLGAGVDPLMVERKILKDKATEVLAHYRKATALISRISKLEKTTVTRADGYTASGGVELGLACNYMVAGPQSKFVLPETGYGILPCLGGTQRLPRKVGKSTGKYLIFTGEQLDGAKALRFGLVDFMADNDGGVDHIVADLIAEDDLISDDAIPTNDEQAAISLFDVRNCRQTLAGEFPKDNPAAEKVKKALDTRAPIAIKLADKLIGDGLGLPLDNAIKWEISALELILQTKDARVGLKSISEGTTPKFKGE